MRGLSVIAYGPEGIGKSTWALQWKKEMLFISINEPGFLNLEMVGEVPDNVDHEEVTSFPQLLNVLKKARDYTTVVVDSMSGLQQIMADIILKEQYAKAEDPQKSFGSFSEGYRVHGPFYAERVVNELTLLNSKGVHTLLLGHTKMETIKNPAGTDYNATVIDMESWPRAVFKKWAAAILYMTLDLDVMVTKTWKGKPTEGKVKTELEDEADRIMFTVKNPIHEAKNLLHLPPYISMGISPQDSYSKFLAKLPPNLQEVLKQ